MSYMLADVRVSTLPRPPHPHLLEYCTFFLKIDPNLGFKWINVMVKNLKPTQHILSFMMVAWKPFEIVMHWRGELKIPKELRFGSNIVKYVKMTTQWQLIETPPIFFQHEIVEGHKRPYIISHIFFLRDKLIKGAIISGICKGKFKCNQYSFAFDCSKEGWYMKVMKT